MRGSQQCGARHQRESLAALHTSGAAARTERNGHQTRENCERLQMKRIARGERQERSERVQSVAGAIAAGVHSGVGRQLNRSSTNIIDSLLLPFNGCIALRPDSERPLRRFSYEVGEAHAAGAESSEAGRCELRDAKQELESLRC